MNSTYTDIVKALDKAKLARRLNPSDAAQAAVRELEGQLALHLMFMSSSETDTSTEYEANLSTWTSENT